MAVVLPIIIFAAQCHDPQAIADRRSSEAVSFAVVARIIIPTSEVAGQGEAGPAFRLRTMR